MPRSLNLFLLSSLVVLVAFPRDAYAYLDPGTGSYILQMIVAGVLGAAFAVKLFWTRIRSFFSRIFSRSPGNDR